MASAMTHAIVGAALGSLAPGTVSPKRRIALAVLLAVLAVLPDLDVVGFYWGIPYEAPMGHRGFTHSILFALLVALAAALVTRGRYLGVASLVFAATASHGLLDAMTDAGLGVGFFVPVSETRHFFPWRPLATSPLSPAAFLGPRGLEILKNEARFVILPTLIVTGAILSFRTLLSRRGTPNRHET